MDSDRDTNQMRWSDQLSWMYNRFQLLRKASKEGMVKITKASTAAITCCKSLPGDEIDGGLEKGQS